MQITWLGLSSFEIKASTGGGDVRIVLDPYQPTVGLKLSRALEAEIVYVSHDGEDANNVAAVGGSPFVIEFPGEYETNGVFAFVTAIDEGRVVRFDIEGMSIVHLGNLSRKLKEDELDRLGQVDVLMLPVGGGRVLTPKVAQEVLASIEPRVVIPMTYHLDGVKEKLEPVHTFTKALGAARQESLPKYKVTRKDLPEDDMLVMTLTK